MAERRVKVVEPGKVPHPREPEPYATLSFGNVEIRLGLTYFHHLVLCCGWGDKESSYYNDDMVMHEAVGEIHKLLHEASKDVPFYPCDMGCGIGEGIHPRPIERNEAGEVTRYAWICTACRDMSEKSLTPISVRKKS
jgi:hypothetical protein